MIAQFTVIKEFPKGGALAKGKIGVVFLKNYWSEGLKKVYIDEKDIGKSPKGLFADKWKSAKPISWKEIFSFPAETKIQETWNFDNEEVPKKEVFERKKYLAPEEAQESIREYRNELVKEFSGEGKPLLWEDQVVIVTLVSKEELKGEKLSSYQQALNEAKALYKRNRKTHFPLYNAVGRIKDCLKDGKPFDEAIRELEGEVADNEHKYNQLLLKFTNSRKFELVAK